MKRVFLFVSLFLFLCVTASVAQQSGSWKAVDDAMGRQGQDQPDGAHRFAMPRSDLKVTANGVEEKAPKTEQEWNDVRGKAITLIEASDLILILGRRVAPPGAVNKDPSVNLAPDVIQKMIAEDPASWTMFAHAMHDSLLPALKAIDAKDAMALSDAGAAIDQGCENCHLKFWYPKDAKKR